MSFGKPADVPAEALGIMTARSLANSHPALLRFLRRNTSVLDVGCGPGILTMEMARRVAPGAVVGMDINPAMIRAAEEASPPGTIENLVFYTGDIRESGWDGEFEVVNAAHTLQWVPDADVALRQMARAAVPGGHVIVLDSDHTKAEWRNAPSAWTRFYDAFLGWREASGLDNAVARRLPGLCESAGLADLELTQRITTVRAGEADFFRVAGRWRMIIESRGRQMVAAGHLAEIERRDAVETFTEWMKGSDASQTVREACIVARRPPLPKAHIPGRRQSGRLRRPHLPSSLRPDQCADRWTFRVRAPAPPAQPVLGEARRGPSRPPSNSLACERSTR